MNITRRLAIFRLAAGSAAATTAAVMVATPVEAQEESKGHFKHPAEYLAAMQAIGWEPVAMFQRLEDGSCHRMGVKESATDRTAIEKTWRKFHAISMRTPAQIPTDDPALRNDWWGCVWQFLYNKGLLEDVTPRPMEKQ